MDDLISRQAAVDALGERPMLWINNDEYTLGARNQYDMDRLALETVPPAQQWIPCSERCPEQSGWYLVSLKNGNVQKAWYRVAPINQGGSYWRSPIKRPLAWMPLPEPWKGDTP